MQCVNGIINELDAIPSGLYLYTIALKIRGKPATKIKSKIFSEIAELKSTSNKARR